MEKIRGTMTVGELKEIIKDLDDDLPLLESGSDHDFHPMVLSVCKVVHYPKQRIFTEYWEDDDNYFDEYQIIEALTNWG